MSKSIRRQLADAQQEIRDLKNAQHESQQVLRLRIAELESDKRNRIADLERQNRLLESKLKTVHRRLYAIDILADAIKREVTESAIDITDTRRVASGNSSADTVL